MASGSGRTAEPALQRTVDRILDQTGDSIMGMLKESAADALSLLDGASSGLQADHDKILSDGRKEAEKIKRQIVGSADLEARNKELVLVEESVDRVFTTALGQIKGRSRSDPDYVSFIDSLLRESAERLGTSDFEVQTSRGDADAVGQVLSKFPGATLSERPVECMGGVRAVSRDDSMAFDNTIDARLARMRPMIRKNVAAKFGLGTAAAVDAAATAADDGSDG